MSILNKFKIAVQIDPQYMSQDRCVFIVDDTNMKQLMNLRLSNVGVSSNVAGDVQYVSNVGAWSTIGSIFLMSGNKPLCSLRRVKDFLAFQNCRGNNNSQIDLKSVDKGTHWGFREEDNSQDWLAQRLELNDKDAYNLFGQASDEYALNRARLHLADVFNLLGVMRIVDCGLIKDLRIVIEWAPKAGLLVKSDNTQLVDAGTYLQPVLMADELLEPVKIGKLSIPYVNMYMESVNVPTGVVNTVQRLEQHLGAFDQRVVNRILLINSLQNDDVNTETYSTSSVQMPSEKINFVINGQKLIQYGGIDHPALKQRLLSDTWGQLNFPIGSNWVQNLSENFMYDNFDQMHLSYGGISLNSYIDELILEYERKPLVDGGSVDVADMNVQGNKKLLQLPNADTTIKVGEMVRIQYTEGGEDYVQYGQVVQIGANDSGASGAGHKSLSLYLQDDIGDTGDPLTNIKVITGADDNFTKASFDMLVYGEVNQRLVVDGGNLDVRFN